MRSSRQIPHADAMRHIRLFDVLDRCALVRFGTDHSPSQDVTHAMRSSARTVWQKDPNCIDEFLAVHEQLSPEDVSCLQQWRKNVAGEFLLLSSPQSTSLLVAPLLIRALSH